jgi:hypothetical protein
VAVDAQNWVGLHSFLAFFGVKDLPANSEAPLDYFLPLLMPRFSELTRKVSDWPEHGAFSRSAVEKRCARTSFWRPFFSPRELSHGNSKALFHSFPKMIG